jgi:hypothetical protein
LGVAFLEGTFSASTAPPEHRYHQPAARAVLNALLPKSGVDIKGEMKSTEELLQASGYADRPEDFRDLIRILDRELRLITPTDPMGVEAADTSAPAADASRKFYELTHDYLVYPLREWLTSKQKATPRGRAELQLEDRAAAWSGKRETRQLPTFWEYVHILGLTSRTTWTETQQRMMTAAGRHHGIRGAIGCLVLLALFAGIGAWRHSSRQSQERARLDGLIDQLLVADVAELPRIADALKLESQYTVRRLEAIADDRERPESDRLRAAFVLVDGPGPRASQLIGYAASCDLPTLAILRGHLAPFAKALSPELWEAARAETATLSTQLHLATLLAIADPAGDPWGDLAPTVVRALLSEGALYLDQWAEFLRPASAQLLSWRGMPTRRC